MLKSNTDFFNELRDFVTMLGWCEEKSIVGISKDKIKNFELEKGLKLGDCLKSYWLFCGEKINIDNIPHYNYSYTFNDYIDINESIDEYKFDYKDDILFEYEIGKEMVKQGLCKSIPNVLILNGILELDVLYFTNLEEKTFNIYECVFEWGKNEVFRIKKQYYSIKYLIRTGIVSALFNVNLQHNQLKTKVPWFKYRLFAISEKFNLNRDRILYDEMIKNLEFEENEILGIDEYEIGFIRFLIEEKGYPLKKEIFDPYAPIITFYEYLKD